MLQNMCHKNPDKGHWGQNLSWFLQDENLFKNKFEAEERITKRT